MKKNRKLILDIINNSDGHLTADEIFIEAKRQSPSIAVGTIYRNLNIMVEENQLCKVYIPGGADRFDTRIDPHQHMICEKCGLISDVIIDELKDAIEKSIGMEISSYTIQIDYVCKACQEKLK